MKKNSKDKDLRSSKKKAQNNIQNKVQDDLKLIIERLPTEIKKKYSTVEKNLKKFQIKAREKFKEYIVSIALLPEKKPDGFEGFDEGAVQSTQGSTQGIQAPKNNVAQEKKESYEVLILVDDSDSKNMPKHELKAKIDLILNKEAEGIDKNLKPGVLLLSQLWTNCHDARYDVLQYISLSAPVFDTGMLSAIKIAEVHKNMVLKKFEKYIVSYVLAGSFVQGKATKESDIDVFIVIDDTDVKRMSRIELKDKLRTIIYSMSAEASQLTGIKRPFQIQTYILTDFWESVKDANPVIFTFLRDGIPFYDRGIFMPWKQLLKMGRIKPSNEAIEMYMGSGEQMIKRARAKLSELGAEDFFYATLYPSQAAIMLYGLPPPTPKETPVILRDVFVKKEKILEDEYVKIMERMLLWRKELEHDRSKKITGAEIDKLLEDSERYLVRIKKLFKQIEKKKEIESVQDTYETIITVLRDVLNVEKVKLIKNTKGSEEKLFENEIVKKGILPEKYSRILKDILTAKKQYDSNKLEKIDIRKLKKEASDFIKAMVDHIQRKKTSELIGGRVKIKYGQEFAEAYFFEKEMFLVLGTEKKEFRHAVLNPDGSLVEFRNAKIEEFENALTHKNALRNSLNQKIMDSLKKILGEKVEILI